MNRPKTSHVDAPESLSRRQLLVGSGAHLALFTAAAALPGRRLFAQEEALHKEEPWGRLEEIGEGIWAVVSTPLKERNFTTTCNGGLIAGKDRLLAIDGYGSADGSAWVARLAREVAGRRPTDVVVTHYHGDHVNGLAGFLDGDGPRPRVWVTEKTRELVKKADAERPERADPKRTELLDAAQVTDAAKPTELDLGGRKVRIHPRSGHTASDVTVEVQEPSVVFFGDLLWNRMFPNYMDAVPSALSKSVRATVRKRPTRYVPGHGPLADAGAVESYLRIIDDVEAAARRSFEKGVPAAEAAKTYELPEGASDWVSFRDTYYETAIGAWHKELGHKDPGAGEG